MMGVTHVSFSLLICTVFGVKVNAWVVIMSVLPDIDHPRSRVSVLSEELSNYLFNHYGHRSITHSLIPAPFLLTLTLIKPDLITILISYTSHLLLDAFTPTGVKLLYPRNTRFTIFNGPIRTGSTQDKIIGLTFTLITLGIESYNMGLIQPALNNTIPRAIMGEIIP